MDVTGVIACRIGRIVEIPHNTVVIGGVNTLANTAFQYYCSPADLNMQFRDRQFRSSAHINIDQETLRIRGKLDRKITGCNGRSSVKPGARKISSSQVQHAQIAVLHLKERIVIIILNVNIDIRSVRLAVRYSRGFGLLRKLSAVISEILLQFFKVDILTVAAVLFDLGIHNGMAVDRTGGRRHIVSRAHDQGVL